MGNSQVKFPKATITSIPTTNVLRHWITTMMTLDTSKKSLTITTTFQDSCPDNTCAISVTAMTRLKSLGVVLPSIRLQLSPRCKHSFDKLFYDDGVRYLRWNIIVVILIIVDVVRVSCHRRSTFWSICSSSICCGYYRFTQTQSCHSKLCTVCVWQPCVGWRSACSTRTGFGPLPTYKYEYEYDYENNTQVHREGVVDDNNISRICERNIASTEKEGEQEELSYIERRAKTVVRAVMFARQGVVSEQDIRILLIQPHDTYRRRFCSAVRKWKGNGGLLLVYPRGDTPFTRFRK